MFHFYCPFINSTVHSIHTFWGGVERYTLNTVQCVYTFWGIEKYTPNTSIEGEIAWTFSNQRIDLCIIRLSCGMVNMNALYSTDLIQEQFPLPHIVTP